MTNTNNTQEFENVQDRLAIPRQTVPKRTPTERVNNFEETYLPLQMDMAIVEASRCIDCPSAPCISALSLIHI